MAENEKWVIAIHDSETRETGFTGVVGTSTDVKGRILSLIKEKELNYFRETGKDANYFISINLDEENVPVRVHGYINLGDSGYCDYTAEKTNDISETSFVIEYADYVIAGLKLRLDAFSERYTESEKAAVNMAVGKLEYIKRIFNKGKITVDEAVAEIRKAAHE